MGSSSIRGGFWPKTSQWMRWDSSAGPESPLHTGFCVDRMGSRTTCAGEGFSPVASWDTLPHPVGNAHTPPPRDLRAPLSQESFASMDAPPGPRPQPPSPGRALLFLDQHPLHSGASQHRLQPRSGHKSLWTYVPEPEFIQASPSCSPTAQSGPSALASLRTPASPPGHPVSVLESLPCAHLRRG